MKFRRLGTRSWVRALLFSASPIVTSVAGSVFTAGSFSALSPFIRAGFAVSFAVAAQTGGSFSVLDALSLGSSLSVSSFARLGSCVSFFGRARFRFDLSVADPQL